MVSNFTQNTHPSNNPSVYIKIEAVRGAAFWANDDSSSPNNKKSTKKNIAHAILQTATEVQSDSTFYDWKHIDSNGNGQVYTGEISTNSSKIFPLRIPERDILKKEQRSKLTIKLSENNQNIRADSSSNEDSSFCTILCTRGSSNKKPLNCRITQQSNGNGYQCDIASNFRKIEANNVKLYGVRNKINNKLKTKQNYTIPTTLILVYNPIDNVYPSAPAFDKGTHPPSYSSIAGNDLYTLKAGYYPPKILNLPK